MLNESPIDEQNSGEVAFVLGSPVENLLDRLPRSGTIYTSSLEDEARLLAAGYPGRYIYRDRDTAFERAGEVALTWLSEISDRAHQAGENAEFLFGDTTIPAWTMSYDALFEIKDGIFDSIFHCVLADQLIKEIGANSNEAIHVFTAKNNQLGQALAQILGTRARVEIKDHDTRVMRAVNEPLALRIWRRVDTLLIHPLLANLRRVWEGPRKPNRMALVGSFGDMARTTRDSRGCLAVHDVYYENLEPALDAVSSNMMKVGINPPRIAESNWKNTFLVWYLILSGAFQPWSAHATPRNVLAVFRNRRSYSRTLTTADADPHFRQLFTVGELNFYELLRPRLIEMLPNLLAAARFHLAIAERFVAREKIKLVISVESFSNLGRCLASALHRRGGQLWGVQGGIISPRKVTNTGFYVPALGGRNELMADLFFAWGPAYCTLLERFGIPAERLRMMGFNRAKQLSPNLLTQKNKRIVYIAGGNALVCPYLMTMEEEYFTLQSLANCLPADVELLVRTHPRHNVDEFRQRLVGKPHVRILAAGEMSLDECLANASCIVGKASTVLLEAAQAGLPVLLINLSGTPDFTGFSNSSSPLPCATDAASLRQHLNQLTAHRQSMHHFVDAWCAGDANSAANVLLNELKTQLS